MRSLKVTAILQTGQIASVDGYLPLDSILAAEWMRRNRPDLCGSMIMGEIIYANLPLKKIDHPKGWYWACSFAQYEKQGEYIAYWHKRFDEVLAEQHADFAGRRGKIAVNAGRYKNYRMPIVIILADKLEWYCVGEPDEIRVLLTGITAIGKKRSQGYGLIDEWLVEDWPEDWSEVGPGGKLMRALHEMPKTTEKANVMMSGMKPPYWAQSNKSIVFMPL